MIFTKTWFKRKFTTNKNCFNPLIQVNDFYPEVDFDVFVDHLYSFNPLIQVNDFYLIVLRYLLKNIARFNPLIQVNDFYLGAFSDIFVGLTGF